MRENITYYLDSDDFFDSVPALACLIDKDGNLLKTNKVFKSMSGSFDLDDAAEKLHGACCGGNMGDCSEIVTEHISTDGGIIYLEWNSSKVKNTFFLIGRNITEKKAEEDKKKKVLEASISFFDSLEIGLDHQKIADDFLFLTGAIYAAFNLYENDGKSFRTMAISTTTKISHMALKILGYPVEKKLWTHDPIRAEKIKNNIITRFEDLSELTEGVIPKQITDFLAKSFSTGNTFIVKIEKNHEMLGDITFTMRKGMQFRSHDLASIYANQLGLAISKSRLMETQKNNEIILKETQQMAKLGRWDHDEQNALLVCSDSISDIFELNGDAPSSFDHFDAVIHPADIIKVKEQRNDAIKNQRSSRIIYRIRTKSGVEKWIEEKIEIACCTRKGSHKALGVIKDITEARLAQIELEHLKEEYRTVFHGTQDSMFLVKVCDDGSFRYIRSNRTHQRSTGITINQLRGKTPQELVGSETGGSIAANYAKCARLGNPIEYEETMELPTGTKTWLTLLNPIIEDGQTTHIAGSSRDITDLKLADEQLKASEEQYRLLVTQMPQGLAVHEIILDENGDPVDYRFLSVNRGFEKMTGLKASEIVGKTVLEVLPSTEKYWIDLYGKVALGGQPHQYENFSGEMGKYFAVYAYSPKHRQFAVIITDITERKKTDIELAESEKKHRQLAENISDVIWTSDLMFNTTYISPSIEKLTGNSPETYMHKSPEVTFPPHSLEKLKSVLVKELEHENDPIYTKERSRYIETEIYHSDGSMLWAGINVSFIRDERKNPVGIQGVARNISEIKRVEHLLYNEKELFRTTLLSVGDAVISSDTEGRIVVFNKAAEKLTGWSSNDAPGRLLEEVFCVYDEKTGQKSMDPVSMILEKGCFVEPEDHSILISRDGEEIPIENSAAPIFSSNGSISGVVLVFRDFTEKLAKQEEIRYLSFHDQLTGLYNRRFFDEELKRLETARNLPLTLVMFDVNGLKLINDAFGHQAGDRLLQRVASIVKRECRSDDIIARIGGDEFIMLLPSTDPDQAERVIRRIDSRISSEKIESIRLSVSFGKETKISMDEDMHKVFKSAEDDMYRHKLTESASMRSAAIEVIVSTLHEKNSFEESHSLRVSEICDKLASAFYLSSREKEELKLLGLLHDIGKITIDDFILKKVDRLDEAEWDEIKRHPETGYMILKSVNEFSSIAGYVLSHHERWDGKGYPKGLKGEQIPFQSRILSIADAYESMTTDLPYRKALGKDAAIAEIVKNSGSQFDPGMVKVFLEIDFE